MKNIPGNAASRFAGHPALPRIALAACVLLAGCAGTQGGSGVADNAGMATGHAEGRSDGAGIAATATGTTDTTRIGTEGCPGIGSDAPRPGEPGCPPAGQDAAMQRLQGVVQQIEWIPVREAEIGVSGALGAAAAGGIVPGMGAPGGYRITLRTDDGSVQSVVVATQPDFNVGERVTYSNGAIARQ
ncbi:hypothetical protein GJV26_07285 [Massilia dura]|uniref:Uncharacterized protein n=1 Tax=Pseudoduganella dura TaxID=321982 RepID=A0A6I3XCK8_9BURK|nr:hypothetical protein [Pseudoduganella dura]MUI12280.1 hypothetical protein [Pseudoduganella dura]GGY07319.1 hypothetical protein GCM10007386_42330 [Pseudoduganella dura]